MTSSNSGSSTGAKRRNDGHLYYDATSNADLDLKVERLRDELAEAAAGAFEAWQNEILVPHHHDRENPSKSGKTKLIVSELWVLLVFLLAKQRVECSAKSGEILQLDSFYFIQH